MPWFRQHPVRKELVDLAEITKNCTTYRCADQSTTACANNQQSDNYTHRNTTNGCVAVATTYVFDFLF